MMMFEEMGYCGDLDMLGGPLGEDGEIGARQAEADGVVEEDYSDEEIDMDELEKRMWKDKMRLKRLKEQCRAKEGIDAAKQRQSQEQARRKKMSRAQEQAKRKKMSRAQDGGSASTHPARRWGQRVVVFRRLQ